MSYSSFEMVEKNVYLEEKNPFINDYINFAYGVIFTHGKTKSRQN